MRWEAGNEMAWVPCSSETRGRTPGPGCAKCVILCLVTIPPFKMSSSDVRENSTVHHSVASMWVLLTNFGVIDSLITFILELQRSRTALAWCQTVSSELLTFSTLTWGGHRGRKCIFRLN